MVELNFSEIVAEELHINRAVYVQWLLRHMLILWRARGKRKILKYGLSEFSSTKRVVWFI